MHALSVIQICPFTSLSSQPVNLSERGIYLNHLSNPLSSTPTHLPQIAELSNLKTHLTLRSLRPAGSRKLGIPKGYGFGLVSCPNYFFECMGWLIIAGMTGSWAGASFLLFLNLLRTSDFFNGLAVLTFSFVANPRTRTLTRFC